MDHSLSTQNKKDEGIGGGDSQTNIGGSLQHIIKLSQSASEDKNIVAPESFNGNFEQWFAKDEYIPRPKLIQIEENKDKMDTARRQMQKKLKRQEQMQKQQQQQADQNKKQSKSNKKIDVKHSITVQPPTSVPGEVLSLEKLWQEIQLLKRHKLDSADFLKFQKKMIASESMHDSNDMHGARKNSKKKLFDNTAGGSLLQTIALALTRDLEKSSSVNSLYPSNHGGGSVSGQRHSKGGGGDYMLDDVMRDMKIAVVDMAAQMKEVRERVSALEENRKIDLAQMNEKWNSHQRKIAKLERMVTGVVKQNERISSSIIQSGLMKTFARENGSDRGEKPHKDYSANREEKLYLRGSLAESVDEHKLSPHPGGIYEKIGLYSQNSSNSQRRKEESQENLQHILSQTQFNFTDLKNPNARQVYQKLGAYHQQNLGLTMPAILGLNSQKDDQSGFKLPPYNRITSLGLTLNTSLQQQANSQNKLPQGLNKSPMISSNNHKIDSVQFDDQLQSLIGNNFTLPRASGTFKSNGYNVNPNAIQDLTQDLLARQRLQQIAEMEESRNIQSIQFNYKTSCHQNNGSPHVCQNCGHMQSISKNFYISGKNSPGRTVAGTQQHVERHKKARFYGIDFSNPSPIDSLPKESRHLSMLNRMILPNGKKMVGGAAGGQQQPVIDQSTKTSSFHPAARAYAGHHKIPSLSTIDHNIKEDGSQSNIYQDDHIIGVVDASAPEHLYQDNQALLRSGQQSPPLPPTKKIGCAAVSRQTQSQFKLGTAASIKAGMSRNAQMGASTAVAAGTGGIAVVEGSQMYGKSSQDSKKYHSDGDEEE